MNRICVYCQQSLLDNEDGICLKCRNKLLDRDASELEVYYQNNIACLFYTLIKIDDYFQTTYSYELPNKKATDEALLFHKRRVACLDECIGHFNKLLFSPRTTEEVILFRKVAKQFWNGELTKKQRDLRVKEFTKGNYYPKADSADYHAKVVLASLMSEKENLDWSWWQYMEIHFVDLYKYVEKSKLLSIVEKYFSKEIQIFIKLE